MRPFKYSPKLVRNIGRLESRIWIVGRFPGQQDHKAGYAFAKGAAFLLREAFGYTEMDFRTAHCRNIVPHLPPLGKVDSWLLPKKELPADALPFSHILGPVGGKYLHPDILPFVAELQQALQEHRPNVIVALGSEACRILTGTDKIGQARGALYDCQLVPGIKVIPTYHPASCFANAAFQPVFNADIIKAVRESAYPERRLKSRRVHVAETVADLHEFRDTYGSGAATVDIETVPNWKQITDVGIAYSDTDVLVIPILDKTKPDYSYWSAPDEYQVWEFIRQVLEDPDVQLRGQGYIYDATWLYQLMLIKSVEYRGDPLVLHHALYPEMDKDLGFLGSLYCDEIAWKNLASFKQAKLEGKLK
ncbi:uracil-DNA glycosylase family protein [Idiomarina abyssalis]|uniref:uracil-DNA glycosylase family protein n=1 Tax=Idiomarina abyssalis TaxID=86102 RepID=UPI003A9570B0